MKIASLDISTSVAGIAVFQDHELTLAEYYRFKKSDDYTLNDLAVQFDEHIYPKIQDCDTIAIEEALKGYGRSTSSIAILIGWNAIVQYKLRNAGHNVVPYHVSSARKLAWGRGRAPKGKDTKTWVLESAIQEYGEDVIDVEYTRYGNIRQQMYDIGDAVTIGRAYLEEQTQ